MAKKYQKQRHIHGISAHADTDMQVDEEVGSVSGSGGDGDDASTDAGSSAAEDLEPEPEPKTSRSYTKRRGRLVDSGVQTGGVGGKPVASSSTKIHPKSVEAQAAKLRMTVPMVDMMPHQPFMRQYLTSWCVEHTTDAGEPVTILEDTKVRAITREELHKERAILAQADPDNLAKVEKQLATVRCRVDRGHKKTCELERSRSKTKGTRTQTNAVLDDGLAARTAALYLAM